MRNIRLQLGELLVTVENYPLRFAVFLPEDEMWTVSSDAVLADIDEMEPDVDWIELDGKRYKNALGLDAVVDVVVNARLQRSDLTVEVLMKAFLYYYDRDAFIEIKRGT